MDNQEQILRALKNVRNPYAKPEISAWGQIIFNRSGTPIIRIDNIDDCECTATINDAYNKVTINFYRNDNPYKHEELVLSSDECRHTVSIVDMLPVTPPTPRADHYIGFSSDPAKKGTVK